VLAVLLAAELFWVAHVLFFVVFLGMLFGIAVSGGVDHLQRFRIPRGVAAVVIVAGFVGLMVGFGAWVAPTLRDQGGELRQKLPEAVDRVRDWVKQRQSGILGLLVAESEPPTPAVPVGARPGGVRRAAPVAGSSAAPVAGSPTGAPSSPDTGAAGAKAGLDDQLKQGMSGLSQYLFPFITSTVEIVGGLLLILFLSIYFAAEPDLYRRGLLSLLPTKRRARGAIMMDRMAVVLRRWLLTQLIAMVVMGIVSTVALLLLHVKAAFALGVLAGLFEFIPTIGPILSALPAVAMGFLDSPEKAAYVAFAYWGLQFLESHILIPLLMKEGLRLPPALTVVTQALLALVFGFIGLMVAVPLLATIMVMVQMFYLEQLPVEGTWTYPVFTPDLDEPIDRAHPHV
jgi:predicted PurR-regulated permease PerM